MNNYFFIGNIEGNTGPSNVNKGIVANLSDRFSIVHSKNKICRIGETVYKTLFCKVVIVSGFSKKGYYMIRLAKIFKKRTIYIMHGCYEIEMRLNNFIADRSNMQIERNMLYNADLILAVSKKFSQIIIERYPFCKEKTKYLYNGIEKIKVNNSNIKQVKGKIIAVGGDRKLKNNITVARAMIKLGHQRGLTVYGYLYNPNNLPKGENIEFKGLIPQEQLYKEMMDSELYILNSVYEPFGLSVFDALFCGCSILISEAAGALELLEVTEHDVIKDPMDESEIAEKILYLLENPNNDRLMKNLDFNKLSYKEEVKKLEKICWDLCLRK